MSNISSRKGTSSNNRTVIKGKVAMCCNVCKNAGKSERDYTSHFTKMLVSDIVTVVCPTILNNVCTYCKEKGHFKAACSILQEKEKRMNTSRPSSSSSSGTASICIPISLKKSKNVTTINVIVSKKAAITKNAFSAAFVDEDENSSDEEDAMPTEEHVVKKRNVLHSWADDNYWDDSEDDM